MACGGPGALYAIQLYSLAPVSGPNVLDTCRTTGHSKLDPLALAWPVVWVPCPWWGSPGCTISTDISAPVLTALAWSRAIAQTLPLLSSSHSTQASPFSDAGWQGDPKVPKSPLPGAGRGSQQLLREPHRHPLCVPVSPTFPSALVTWDWQERPHPLPLSAHSGTGRRRHPALTAA